MYTNHKQSDVHTWKRKWNKNKLVFVCWSYFWSMPDIQIIACATAIRQCVCAAPQSYTYTHNTAAAKRITTYSYTLQLIDSQLMNYTCVHNKRSICDWLHMHSHMKKLIFLLISSANSNLWKYVKCLNLRTTLTHAHRTTWTNSERRSIICDLSADHRLLCRCSSRYTCVPHVAFDQIQFGCIVY